MAKKVVRQMGVTIESDAKFDKAVACFLEAGRGSIPGLQRKLGLGFTRAAAICDQMEAFGLIGPYRGTEGYELLVSSADWRARRKVLRRSAVDAGKRLR